MFVLASKDLFKVNLMRFGQEACRLRPSKLSPKKMETLNRYTSRPAHASLRLEESWHQRGQAESCEVTSNTVILVFVFFTSCTAR